MIGELLFLDALRDFMDKEDAESALFVFLKNDMIISTNSEDLRQRQALVRLHLFQSRDEPFREPVSQKVEKPSQRNGSGMEIEKKARRGS